MASSAIRITSGFLHDIALALPSYWLVQAGRLAIGGQGWGATGWLVIAIWTVVLTVLALRLYRRDTGRTYASVENRAPGS
jgi:ABC-2 type transport system permease protein